MKRGFNNMQLNEEKGRLLGVCAGIADYLDFPAAPIRVIFVVCVLLWPPLVIAYFLAYLCLDRDLSKGQIGEFFRNGKTAEHFRNLNYRRPIYKNTANKRIAGVCAGVADYLNVSPFAVRIVAIASVFILGPYVFLGYIICMFVLEADPQELEFNSSRFQQRRQNRRNRRQRRRERHQERVEQRMAKRRHQHDYRSTDTDRESNFDSAVDDLADLYSQGAGEGADFQAQTRHNPGPAKSRQECAAIYNNLELRLREIEAFITSKQFQLHCEITRI